MTGFDIDAQAAAAKTEDEGTVVHIHGLDEMPMYYEGPDKKPVPVTITVAGAHSPRYRRIEEAQRQRKLKRSQFTGAVIFDDNIEKMSGCTLAWDGFFVNGQPVDCTSHNASQLYRRCPWVYEQVLEAAHDHSRFFGSGSTPPVSTSSSTQG